MNDKDAEYCWVGSEENFVDKINIHRIKHIVLGRFGGNSSAGQYKNEDGCIVWVSEKYDWEFAVLLDAHKTAESAELVVTAVNSLKESINIRLTLPVHECIDKISDLILSTFKSEDFKKSCQKIQGETACLIVVRKGKFIWWLSIGDCILYLNHPELSALYEYQQNQRSFYEWVGRVNTFDLPVPCYSSGRKELRRGRNHLFMTTDGLTECPNTKFNNPKEIFKLFKKLTNDHSVSELLKEIKDKNVRDSTTIVSWFIDIETEASQPSI